MPTAIIAFSRLGPSTATQASAMSVSVNENRTSEIRIRIVSSEPRA